MWASWCPGPPTGGRGDHVLYPCKRVRDKKPPFEVQDEALLPALSQWADRPVPSFFLTLLGQCSPHESWVSVPEAPRPALHWSVKVASAAVAWLNPGGPWSLSQPRDGQAETVGTERGHRSLLGPWPGPHRGAQDPPRGARGSALGWGSCGGRGQAHRLSWETWWGWHSDPWSRSLGHTAKGAVGVGACLQPHLSPHLCTGDRLGPPVTLRPATQRCGDLVRCRLGSALQSFPGHAQCRQHLVVCKTRTAGSHPRAADSGGPGGARACIHSS